VIKCGGMPQSHKNYGAPKGRGIVLQPRDYDLLQGLYESRIMTRQHICDIYFDGKAEAGKKRVQKLLGVGLLSEQARQPNEPATLTLANQGYRALLDAGLLNHYPQQDWRSFQKRVKVSDARIRHELDVMSVKAAFARSIRSRDDLVLAEFSTWPKLFEFQARRPMIRQGYTHDRKVLMKPDGFVRIHQQTPQGTAEHCLFLEVDRGSETLATVASKILGYRDYYHKGGFAQRMGFSAQEREKCPFRVLLVAPSERRIAGVAGTLLQQRPPIQSLAWMTTLDSLLTDPLKCRWYRPMDFTLDVEQPVGVRLLEQ